MKKIENNKWYYALAFGATTTIMALLIFPFFDFILDKTVLRTQFEYTLREHFMSPIALGILTFIVALIIKKNPDKGKDDKKNND